MARSLSQPQLGVTSAHPHRHWLWRALMGLVGAFTLFTTFYLLLIWPWISRWGATEAETRQSLPGDQLITTPSLVTTKAVTIDAPPATVWSWLAQLGVDRGGMYSYLWVENGLMRLNVTNTNEVRPEWQQVQVGDFIRFTPKEYALNPGPGLYVMGVEPGHSLTGCFGLEGWTAEKAAAACSESATWQFVLVPQGDHSTRLLLRSRTAGPPALVASTIGKLVYAPQFYMERKMLLEIKARAEGSHN